MIYLLSIYLGIVIIVFIISIINEHKRSTQKLVPMPCSWQSKTYREYKKLLKNPVEIQCTQIFGREYYCMILFSWDMRYYSNTGVISIGCKDDSIEGWKYFFSDECKIEYTTSRDTLAFKYIKTKFYQFLNELEKQAVI